MDTFTSSRRAVVATALGLALSLSLAACSRSSEGGATPATGAQASQAVSTQTPTPAATPDPTSDPKPDASYVGEGGCSLIFIYGDLVADNGRTVLVTSPNYSPYWDHAVPLNWPDGWEIRATDGGQVEIVDDTGTVRARTGTFVHITAETDNGDILFRDGELVVCPIIGPRPAPFPRPDDWTTETSHIEP
jgi:hypothetical protein